MLTELSKEAEKGETTAGGWKLNYDYQFELIRMLVYPLIRPLFSPKIMTMILINLQIMGNPLKLGEKIVTFDDVKPYFMGIIRTIITQLKDMINEMLYTWVIEKLTPLLTMFMLRTLMEQIEMYRLLITDLITSCAFGSLNGNLNFNNNKRRVGIDNVDYVDIDPVLEQQKQTSVSTSNC